MRMNPQTALCHVEDEGVGFFLSRAGSRWNGRP